MRKTLGGGWRCRTCQKPVYYAERFHALGADFHKPCFVCASCSKVLSPGAYLTHDKDPYCQTCYNVSFGPEGFRANTNVVQKKAWRPMNFKAGSSFTLVRDPAYKPQKVVNIEKQISHHPNMSDLESQPTLETKPTMVEVDIEEHYNHKENRKRLSDAQIDHVEEVYRYNFLQVLSIVARIRPNNLIGQFLSKKMFLSYSKNLQDTLFSICISGLENYNTDKVHTGIFATDSNDFETFSTFFEPVLETLFNIKMSKAVDFNQNLNFSFIEILLKKKVQEFKIEITRNFQQFSFCQALSKAERESFEKKIVIVLEQFFPSKSKVDLNNIENTESEALDSVRSFQNDKYYSSANFIEDFPQNRGVFEITMEDLISKNVKVSVFYGFVDHLKLQFHFPNANEIQLKSAEELSNRLTEIMTALSEISKENELTFSTHPKLGFLTPDVTNLGLGLSLFAKTKRSADFIEIRGDLSMKNNSFNERVEAVLEGF